MQQFNDFWGQADAIGRAVVALLLLMSISAWVLIFWKGWVLKRAATDLTRAVPAFWEAGNLDEGRARLGRLDREALLLPHRGLAHLQFGQVVLASVGATAPFVGLFGTVWGIYHALVGISLAGSITIEKVSGPVGEALIMTAAGLAVAIPAVLAYNVFGKKVGACEADLEGFAHDLREMVLDQRSEV